MDYIINPSWFYWISVLDVLRMVFIAVFVVAVFLLLVCIASIIGDWDELEEGRTKKYTVILGVVCTALLLSIIFIPSKQVLMEMMIAKYATHENAHVAVETVKSAVDYIIEAIKDLK